MKQFCGFQRNFEDKYGVLVMGLNLFPLGVLLGQFLVLIYMFIFGLLTL